VPFGGSPLAAHGADALPPDQRCRLFDQPSAEARPGRTGLVTNVPVVDI